MTTIQASFGSDNVAAVSPEIFAAMQAANAGSVHSYGDDAWTAQLSALASTVFERAVTIFPVTTGSAANALALSVMSPPFGAIYCHEAAHITTDECGAPEFFTAGAKVVGLPSADGKLRPGQLDQPLRHAAAMGVHHVQPAVVSLTQSTEWGTVYTPAEVRAVSAAAHGHGLSVHMDGARLANAIVHLGCRPAEITWRAGVDVLSLGATKNGAMAAEAVVFFDRDLARGFAARRKRGGHLLSKMRYLSAQLVAYLQDGLWLRNARHANAMAARMQAGLLATSGVRPVQPVEANELFVAMPDGMIDALLAEGFEFYRWSPPAGVSGSAIRLVCSFATSTAEVDALLAAVRRHAETDHGS